MPQTQAGCCPRSRQPHSSGDSSALSSSCSALPEPQAGTVHPPQPPLLWSWGSALFPVPCAAGLRHSLQLGLLSFLLHSRSLTSMRVSWVHFLLQGLRRLLFCHHLFLGLCCRVSRRSPSSAPLVSCWGPLSLPFSFPSGNPPPSPVRDITVALFLPVEFHLQKGLYVQKRKGHRNVTNSFITSRCYE